jgi:hypothetical protein
VCDPLVRKGVGSNPTLVNPFAGGDPWIPFLPPSLSYSLWGSFGVLEKPVTLRASACSAGGERNCRPHRCDTATPLMLCSISRTLSPFVEEPQKRDIR